MTLTSWKSGSLAAAFCIALWASPSAAQRADDMRGGGQHPCTGDAQRLCSQFIPDRGKVASCLSQNRGSLSQACAAVMGGGKAKVSRKAKGKRHGKRKRRHRH